MKVTAKKILEFSGKVLTSFILGMLQSVFKTSKNKKHQPTLTETTYGEKMLFSDNYYVNDEKSHK